MIFEYLHLAIDGIVAISIIFGGIKLYYVLYFYPPHSHTEKGRGTPLTTDGIEYPRDAK